MGAYEPVPGATCRVSLRGAARAMLTPGAETTPPANVLCEPHSRELKHIDLEDRRLHRQPHLMTCLMTGLFT